MYKGINVRVVFSASLLVLSGSPLAAQTIVGSGYTEPAPVSVAPGQIATFYVDGLASTTGLKAAVLQGSSSFDAPIQSVSKISTCPSAPQPTAGSCGALTAVTVQIPYELIPICPLCASPIAYTAPAELAISQGGAAPALFQLNVVADQVHVLTQCDVALSPGAPPQPPLNGLRCQPLVTHADGTLVTASTPADVGETLTAWAFGLGQTNPAAPTGEKAKAAPTIQTFSLGFNYQINALPAKPWTGDLDRVPPHPLYTGLVAGFVGLYQVNFTVPDQPPNGTPRCVLPVLPPFAVGGNTVQSNLTVSIGGQFSFDGAGICVKTQIPVD